MKLFADDTSLFCVVCDSNISAYELNNDMQKISDAIKGTSQNKLCSELDFESLKFRRLFRKLCTFFKIKRIGKPEYLCDIIPKTNHLYNTRLLEVVTTFYGRTDVFK